MKKDPLLFNKISAALLFALLVGVLGDTLGEFLLAPHAGEKQELAYNIGGDGNLSASASTASAAPVVIESVLPLLASSDPEAGGILFKRVCASCHAVSEGVNKIGPSLWNIIGKNSASDASYKYSNAFKNLNSVWDYQEVNEFITKPSKYVRGTKMTYAGMRSIKDRAKVIAYLRSLSPSPLPLPDDSQEQAQANATTE